MLSSLTIQRYQSLQDVKLELGRFTVITGASSAGKSAVIRALKLLAFNARGTAFITQGQKSCMVVAYAEDEDRGVAIARSTGGRGEDSYVINDSGNESVFTKLAGAVPEEVKDVLGLSELNFAAQFDPPFLLSDSAASVARMLGSLTNVTLLFSAAAESNRRRLRVKDQLTDRTAEVARLHTEIAQYRTLRARTDAARTAEEGLGHIDQLAARAARLRQLLGAVSTAQAAVQAVPVPAPLPSLDKLTELVDRRTRLASRITEIKSWGEAWQAQGRAASSAAADADSAERELHKVLADAGVCPLCGQVTREAA